MQPESTAGYCADHPTETGSVVVWKGRMEVVNAKEACKADGMRLAVFRSQQELDDIQAIIGITGTFV